MKEVRILSSWSSLNSSETCSGRPPCHDLWMYHLFISWQIFQEVCRRCSQSNQSSFSASQILDSEAKLQFKIQDCRMLSALITLISFRSLTEFNTYLCHLFLFFFFFFLKTSVLGNFPKSLCSNCTHFAKSKWIIGAFTA